jgi:DNA helicase II / ATP-dependent DNA helicase PcrA
VSRLIACGHCGDAHATVAEVRSCAVEHPDAGAAPQPGGDEPVTGSTSGPAEAPGDDPVTTRHAPRPALRGSLAREGADPEGLDAAGLAGPEALGRSVLVLPGQVPPAPWAGAERLVLGAAPGPAHVDRLHQAWLARQRLVVEWPGEVPAAGGVLEIPFWELTADTEIPGERLRFLLTANVVDARDPAGARFEPLRRAVALGARPEGPGDVVLADGSVAWVDGGPLEPFGPDDLDGHPMVPRVHLVGGLLGPLPPARATGAELAPDQLAAVAHRRGPARIIAPAGSGKTRVLTERTRHLVRDRGVQAAVVSLVAYNRRAREEMGDRLRDVVGLDIRTLNSLALAIAGGTGAFRRPGASAPPTTIDEREVRALLERLVPARRRRANTDPLEAWVDALSACRLGLRSPADIEAEYSDVTGFVDVLGRYRDELRRRNLLDFDEQVLAAIEVLLTDPAARDAARAVAPVLLVDEFQDLTPAHVLLVRLLAGPAVEVFGVGDDDQTIYGYTGASPSWLVGFAHYFPGAHDHPLTVNYRCPPAVVDAATNLLSHNRLRVSKDIHPAPGRPADDGTLQVANPGPDLDRALVDHVQALLAQGATPAEIAVLSRVNAALLAPLVFLGEAGVPVRRPPGVDDRLLDRSGTSAALAWLRLATAPERRLEAADLRAALRRPPRSLHPRIADWVCEQRSVADLLALAGRVNNEREREAIASLADDLARLRHAAAAADTAGLLDLVYHDVGLLSAASQLDSSQRTARRAAHSDELQALRAVAALHPEPEGFDRWLRGRLAELARVPDGATVTLATIHATKGLEWPHVVVHDVRRDLYPHHLADDVEEERRVFHVAITRGERSVLVLTGSPPSPFVAELTKPRPPDQPWPEPPRAREPVPASTPPRSERPRRDRDPTPAHEALRAWRLKLARADKVPPYVVFNDATLDAIIDAAPTTLAELGRVKGIGPTKLDRYGDEILGVLAEFA